MKKLPLLALALLSFCSCSKDDETPDNELVGTTWSYHSLEFKKYTPIEQERDYKFISNDSVIYHCLKIENVTDTIYDWTNTLNYELDYPDMRIKSETFKFDNHWQFTSLENGMVFKKEQ